jgi:hypothetical protein
MINVYTVLSISFSHTKEYVYKLKRSIERNSTVPFNFFCLTNEQLPGINTIPVYEYGQWVKMDLCDPKINGRVLYLDIDTVLLGNIDFLLHEDQSFMCKSFNGQRRTQIMSLDENQRNEVWNFWIDRRESIMQNFRGEGSVYDFVLDKGIRTLQEIHPRKIINFNEANDFIPMGSKVITFSNRDYPKNLEENNYIKKYW